jgi:hypothetical protein
MKAGPLSQLPDGLYPFSIGADDVRLTTSAKRFHGAEKPLTVFAAEQGNPCWGSASILARLTGPDLAGLRNFTSCAASPQRADKLQGFWNPTMSIDTTLRPFLTG